MQGQTPLFPRIFGHEAGGYGQIAISFNCVLVPFMYNWVHLSYYVVVFLVILVF